MFSHSPPSYIFGSAAECSTADFYSDSSIRFAAFFGGDGARERRFKIRCHRGKAVICHDAEIVRAQHLGRALRELLRAAHAVGGAGATISGVRRLSRHAANVCSAAECVWITARTSPRAA